MAKKRKFKFIWTRGKIAILAGVLLISGIAIWLLYKNGYISADVAGQKLVNDYFALKIEPSAVAAIKPDQKAVFKITVLDRWGNEVKNLAQSNLQFKIKETQAKQFKPAHLFDPRSSDAKWKNIQRMQRVDSSLDLSTELQDDKIVITAKDKTPQAHKNLDHILYHTIVLNYGTEYLDQIFPDARQEKLFVMLKPYQPKLAVISALYTGGKVNFYSYDSDGNDITKDCPATTQLSSSLEAGANYNTIFVRLNNCSSQYLPTSLFSSNNATVAYIYLIRGFSPPFSYNRYQDSATQPMPYNFINYLLADDGPIKRKVTDISPISNEDPAILFPYSHTTRLYGEPFHLKYHMENKTPDIISVTDLGGSYLIKGLRRGKGVIRAVESIGNIKASRSDYIYVDKPTKEIIPSGSKIKYNGSTNLSPTYATGLTTAKIKSSLGDGKELTVGKPITLTAQGFNSEHKAITESRLSYDWYYINSRMGSYNKQDVHKKSIQFTPKEAGRGEVWVRVKEVPTYKTVDVRKYFVITDSKKEDEQSKKEDDQRKKDIAAIQVALEKYRKAKGSYPDSGGAKFPNRKWSNSADASWIGLAAVLKPYLDPLPKDPQNSTDKWSGAGGLNYSYYSQGYGKGSSCQWYMLVYRLEKAGTTADQGVSGCDNTRFKYGKNNNGVYTVGKLFRNPSSQTTSSATQQHTTQQHATQQQHTIQQQQPVLTFRLKKGWNSISLPYSLTAKDPQQSIFKGLPAFRGIIWTYYWDSVYKRILSTAQDKHPAGRGYYTYASKDQTVKLTNIKKYTQLQAGKQMTITLKKTAGYSGAWNLLGNPFNKTIYVKDWLVEYQGKQKHYLDAGDWVYHYKTPQGKIGVMVREGGIKGGKGLKTISQVRANQGFWVDTKYDGVKLILK